MKMKKAKKFLLSMLTVSAIASTVVLPVCASSTSKSFYMDDDASVYAITNTLTGTYGKGKVYNSSSSEKKIKYKLQSSDGSSWSTETSGTVSIGSTMTTNYYAADSSTTLWRVYVYAVTSLLPKTTTGTMTLYTK